MDKFEDISTHLLGINMRAGNSLLKNESSFIDAAKMIGIDVNKKQNTIVGFIVHPDGDRDYGNLSDEVIGIVDECKRIAGLIEDAPTEQDADNTDSPIDPTDEQAGVLYCIPSCCLICNKAIINGFRQDERGAYCSRDDESRATEHTCEHFSLRDFGQEIKTVVEK